MTELNYLTESINIVWIDDDFENENSDLYALVANVKGTFLEKYENKKINIYTLSSFKEFSEIEKYIPAIIILDLNFQNIELPKEIEKYAYYLLFGKEKIGMQIDKKISSDRFLSLVPKIILTNYTKDEIGKMEFENEFLKKYIYKQENKVEEILVDSIIELLNNVPFKYKNESKDQQNESEDLQKNRFIHSLELINKKSKKERKEEKQYYLICDKTTNEYKIALEQENNAINFIIPHQIDAKDDNIRGWFNNLTSSIQKDEFEIYSENQNYSYIKENVKNKTNNHSIEIWAAATPLTAYNPEMDKPIIFDNYYRKLVALKHMGFDKIILKTVYKEKDEKNIEFEKGVTYSNVRGSSSFQSNNINLYNTGKTMKENISPEELKDFLNEKIESNNYVKPSNIIISLGSHSNDKNIWGNLFELYKDSTIDFIEINTRHALRYMTKRYTNIHKEDKYKTALIGLDEYFISPDSQKVWNEIEKWLHLLNDLGKKHKKRIILKIPYRSDINIIASIINGIFEPNEEYGIWGVSAINTIKSPHIDMRKGDFTNIPQYSGEDLGFLRNMTLYTLKNILLKQIKIIAIGGIVNEQDVKECISLGADAVQLSTVGLVYLKDTKTILDNDYENKNSNEEKDKNKILMYDKYRETRNIKRFIVYKVEWDGYKCVNCGKCVQTAYCDAIVNKFADDNITEEKYYIPKNYPLINKDLCTGCGVCVGVCGAKALELKPQEVKLENKKCPICGTNWIEKKDTLYLGVRQVGEGENYYCTKCDSLIINDDKMKLHPLYINGMEKEKVFRLGDTETYYEFKKNNNDFSIKITGQYIQYLSYIKLDFGNENINLGDYIIEFRNAKDIVSRIFKKNGNIYMSAYRSNDKCIVIGIKKNE